MGEDACRLSVVLVTAPRGRGAEIAKVLLEERLAACVNVVGITSLYWWEGSINNDDEDLLIIKTRRECIDELIETLKRVHPYQVPEVIALDTARVLDSYLAWACREASCASKG